jgi:hypothetical protein
MPSLTDTFGVSLKAYTELDKSSLERSTKAVGDAFGKAYSGSGKSAQGAHAAITQSTLETERFGGAVSRVRAALNATWHTAGLGKTVDQVREAGRSLREFHDTAEKTSKLFGGAGESLLGLAGIGGIGMALERFASRSTELSNTAGNFGVSTSMLQRFSGAAGLAGLGPGAATSAIGGLQQTLFHAQMGMNGTALGAANRLGLNVYEDPGLFLKHLADKIKTQAPQVQREIAEAFGVQDLLPLLRKGSQAIDELTAAASRHRELTGQQIEQGRVLHDAYEAASQSTLGFADALSARLSPSLTPLLTGFSTWLDDLKQSPDALDNVGKGIEVLAGLVGGTLVSGFARLSWAMTSWWARPAVRFLSGLGGGAGLVAAAYAYLIPKSFEQANDPDFQRRFMDPSFDPRSAGGAKPGSFNSLAAGALGAIPNGSDMEMARAALGAAGLNPIGQAGALAAMNAESGLDATKVRPGGTDSSWAQWVGKRRERLLALGWNPADAAASRQAASKLLTEELLANPGLVARMNAAATTTDAAKMFGFTFEQGGADASRFGGGGYNQAGLDAFHSKGAEQFYEVITGGGQDSFHRVEIVAPPGFQAVTRMARGAAELTTRSQTAFSTP